MQHPCEKCGAPVEDGVTFCPQCGAPQIRVGSFGDEPATPPMPPGTPGEVQPPAQPVAYGQRQPVYGYPPPVQYPRNVNWRAAMVPAITFGAIAGLLSATPIVSLGCCLWMLVAGGGTVAMYRSRASESVSAGMGFRLGMFTGVIGFAIDALISVVKTIAGGTEKVREAMQRSFEQSMSRQTDPQAQQMMQKLVDFMMSPQGFATMFVIGLAVLFVAFVLITGAGGAIGAAMFGRREQ